MSDDRRLAIVYGLGAAAPSDVIRASADIGQPVFVTDTRLPHNAAMADLLREIGPTFDLASRAEDDLVRELHGSVSGITTFSESMLRTTARLAAGLGLNYHTVEVANRLTDKGVQRRTLNKAGVSPVWQADVRTTEDLRRVARDAPYPVVLKPAHGQSSRDTYACGSAQELLSAARTVPDGGWVVEEMLVGGPNPGLPWLGDYCSVESAVVEGEVWHYGITDKLPLTEPFRETGDVLPTSLPPAVQTEVRSLASAAIAALGVTAGLVHTEVKLTTSGPKIIEVNGRLGGDFSRLLRRISDFDPVRLGLQIALGERPTPTPYATTKTAFFYSILPPTFMVRVRSLAGTSAFRDLPGVWAVDRPARLGSVLDWRRGTGETVYTIWAETDEPAALPEMIADFANVAAVEYESVSDEGEKAVG